MNIQIFDYAVNLTQSLIWQYGQATSLLSLLNQKQTWYTTNQTQFWTDWYNNVFNLLTANAFGLSVWSYILNVPLFINFTPEPSNKPLFGFNAGSFGSYENTYLNFGNSNFSTRGAVLSLTLEEQRFLLRLRYFQLTTRGDITDINAFLDYLIRTSNIGFTGKMYVLDGLNMTMTYVFTTDDFPDELLEVMQTLDESTSPSVYRPGSSPVLPRPAGVRLRYYTAFAYEFGFNAGSFGAYENSNTNFGNGNLAPVLT